MKKNVIIWDFDGVIIFSNEVRDQGFRTIFREFKDFQIEELLVYHRANGGLSRYVKIRFFYEKILKTSITDTEVMHFANKFSEIMKIKLTNKSLMNKDWLVFMENKGHMYTHHIASGSDGKELNGLCKALGIHRYFKSIEGSPKPKNEIVKNIMERESYDENDVVLIGDAINDFEAAKVNNIHFRGYNNEALKVYGDYYEKLV